MKADATVKVVEDSEDEEEEEEDNMKPIDLADRSALSSAEDGELRISYSKKESTVGDEDEDDEDEEIEVDDIDDRFDEKKKSSYYEESIHTDENSNDAKTSSETRLPILKSMLSPSDQQTEEKIGKCALLSTTFASLTSFT